MRLRGGAGSVRRDDPCGTIAGPLFIVSSGVQALTRPGFDLRRHAISMLTLGDQGWMQRATFVTTGLLVLVAAAGIRRARPR